MTVSELVSDLWFATPPNPPGPCPPPKPPAPPLGGSIRIGSNVATTVGASLGLPVTFVKRTSIVATVTLVSPAKATVAPNKRKQRKYFILGCDWTQGSLRLFLFRRAKGTDCAAVLPVEEPIVISQEFPSQPRG